MGEVVKRRKKKQGDFIIEYAPNVISQIEYKTAKEAYDFLNKSNKFIHEMYHRSKSKASYRENK